MIGKLKKFLLGAVCASMCLGMVACGGTEDPGNNPGGTTGGNTNPPEPEPVKIEEPFDINNEEHINWYGRTYVESIRSGGGSHGGGAELHLAQSQAHQLIHHQGDGVSHAVLEHDGEPEELAAAHLLGGGGDSGQAGGVKQVEQQE